MTAGSCVNFIACDLAGVLCLKSLGKVFSDSVLRLRDAHREGTNDKHFDI